MLNKRRIATFLKRAPWTGILAQKVYRRFLPWMTAGAVGAIFNDAGHVLLVEHVFHPKFPWGLPGGWMSKHEDPAETVRREVWEETTLRVQVIRPLIIIKSPYVRQHLDIAYLCYAPPDAGEIKLSEELLSYQWYDADAPENRANPLPLSTFHSMVLAMALAESPMNLMNLAKNAPLPSDSR